MATFLTWLPTLSHLSNLTIHFPRIHASQVGGCPVYRAGRSSGRGGSAESAVSQCFLLPLTFQGGVLCEPPRWVTGSRSAGRNCFRTAPWSRHEVMRPPN